MKRREFITLAGGAVAAWPITVRAQQTAMPVVGFLGAVPEVTALHLIAAFLRELAEAGYLEGKNIVIEYRWNNTSPELMVKAAGDLVRRNVNVIFAAGPEALAEASNATTRIPIVGTDTAPPHFLVRRVSQIRRSHCLRAEHNRVVPKMRGLRR
jgi:putative ABC transport system substrate-binding protein